MVPLYKPGAASRRCRAFLPSKGRTGEGLKAIT